MIFNFVYDFFLGLAVFVFTISEFHSYDFLSLVSTIFDVSLQYSLVPQNLISGTPLCHSRRIAGTHRVPSPHRI